MSTPENPSTFTDQDVIPPFELKKLVNQTLNLQRQVQLAQKTAHNRMLALKGEIDQLSEDNAQKEKAIKKLDAKCKLLKKKNDEYTGLITKLKPYKTQYQQLTLQNADLTQRLQKYKENSSSESSHKQPSQSSSSINTSSTTSSHQAHSPITSGSHSKLHNNSFGAPPHHDSRPRLSRRSSTSSIRGDDSPLGSDHRRLSVDATKRNSMSLAASPLNHFPPLFTILNDFNPFNNALMTFLDATTHLTIFDSCCIVHALIVACQTKVDATLEESTDTILDTLYSAHNQTSDSKNVELFKRDQIKQSKAFQNFIKQFRQIEYQNLLDKDRITTEIVDELLKEYPDKAIEGDTFIECINTILPIIWKFSLKALRFKSNQQEELKGKTWDIAKYDLLDSGSERGEEITVVVRPSLVRKNGKEVKKALVCCAPQEESSEAEAPARG